MFQSTVAKCWWCCSGACRAAADWAETLPVPDADCRLEPRRTAALYSRPPCYWAATAGEHQHQLLGLHPLAGKLLFYIFPSIWCLPCPVPAASCGPGWCWLLLSWASYRDTNKPRPRPAHTSRNTRGDISLHLGGGSRRRCRVNILWRCIDKSGITHRNNLQERSYFILYFHCLWSGCCWLGLFSKIINIICKVAL